MRLVEKEFFWGSSNQVSALQTEILEKRLSHAMSNHSGLQQPPRSESEAQAIAAEEERKVGTQELIDAVADIACAFGLKIEEVLE